MTILEFLRTDLFDRVVFHLVKNKEDCDREVKRLESCRLLTDPYYTDLDGWGTAPQCKIITERTIALEQITALNLMYVRFVNKESP